MTISKALIKRCDLILNTLEWLRYRIFQTKHLCEN